MLPYRYMATKKTVTSEWIPKNRLLIAAGILVMVIIIITIRKSQPSVDNTSTLEPTAFPSPLVIVSTDPTDQDKYMEMAINDLASKLKVDRSLIELTKVTAQTFGNTSLGCPKPGMMYAQVLTPGYTIELMYLDKTYTYHAGSNKVVTC